MCFETLSNDLRLQILKALEKGPLSVKALARSLKAEQSRLSHSLSMLRQCNYVAARVKGKQRIYELNPKIKNGLELQSDKANIFEYMDLHINLCCNNHCAKRQSMDFR